MTKRPGVAAAAGGALLALLGPSPATAQDAENLPREPRGISGGYTSWTTDGTRLPDAAVSFDVAEPAVRDAADRAWFPATGGGTDPVAGTARVELAGTARLTGATAAAPLVLGGLRLDLRDGTGTLRTRTVTGGEVRELALADLTSGGPAPAVRTSGVTWSGLDAALTEEGARLLSGWSGREFAAGDGLGRLAVTVGTGSTAETPAAPRPAPSDTPDGTPATTPTTPPPTAERDAPAAAVRHTTLAPGGEQTVTGTGFTPGEIVLVAIDADTRYQTAADERGRLTRAFPVYATATEGAHTVGLTAVSGGHRAVARFDVRASH
ncbi:HtaA domain-containing protein [Streptomyces sp. ISL-12]|uniref:HtaA domain-containing protein n=1 Tax=Streptomyces sp. ISL-12 TaxID=2819177 RepID=UPI001BE756E0|nr:HtaA domain-containing protein [Streptomyces sp. ISL-12]MBT2412712.1 HtaA domain-containing protein [Streptomyces sp. ISL-12]